MNYPKVSIIIPVYNGSKYIRQALDSALNQSYSNIEVIVINDGSNDDGKTDAVLEPYKSRVRYYYKKNGGVSSALNLGISMMKGEYFSWLSHDDIYYPEKIEKQIQYLRDRELIGKKVILYSNYDLIDNNSKHIKAFEFNHEELLEKHEYSLLRGALNGNAVLIPKTAFEDCGLFDERLKTIQDYSLWHKMMAKYQFIHMGEILVASRYHQEQVSNVSPLVETEGNIFWIQLIDSISHQRKIELEGSEHAFFYGMAKFLMDSPYDEAFNYCIMQLKRHKGDSDYVRKSNELLKEQKNKKSMIMRAYRFIKNNGVLKSFSKLKQRLKKLNTICCIIDMDKTTAEKEE